MRSGPMRLALLAVPAALLLANLAVGLDASAAPADGHPRLTEIEGAPSEPAGTEPVPANYEEHEYFLDGEARAYPGSDSERVPYRTRLLVRVPKTAETFSGTASVEWYNVSGQTDTAPDYQQGAAELHRSGHAAVFVSAQQASTRFLTASNPTRYSSLNHPGDTYSWDIFSQAGYVLKHPSGDDPFAGLRTVSKNKNQTRPVDLRLLGSGNSQSASRLYDYIRNGALRGAGVYDGLLLTSGGSTAFDPATGDVPSVPVLTMQSESEAASPSPTTFQSDLYRAWWIAGTSHVDSAQFAVKQDDRLNGQYGELGGVGGPSCAVRQNEFPKRYAQRAAVRALVTWIRGGAAAPQGTALFTFDPTTGMPVRDADGNIVGGTRLAPMDVPVAEYNGQSCVLLGHTIPFDDLKLRARYPSHADYMAKLRAAINGDLAGRFLVAADAADLLKRAEGAAFRWEGPVSTPYPIGH